MKTIITVIALVLSSSMSLSQGMYNPLEEPNDSDTSFYINEVWYKDPVGEIHAYANDNDHGQQFLNEVLELFQIDRKSPTKVVKEGKTTYYYFETPAAEEFRFYICKSIPNEPFIGIQITLNH
jgi:hypothetical protein